MMGVIYKILPKAIALRIGPFLCHTIRSSQFGSIGGRSISDNILAAQLGIEYTRRSQQETVLLQLDFAKASSSID